MSATYNVIRLNTGFVLHPVLVMDAALTLTLAAGSGGGWGAGEGGAGAGAGLGGAAGPWPELAGGQGTTSIRRMSAAGLASAL